jgi:hypothetical protein
MRRPQTSKFIYACIAIGMVLAPAAWAYFESPIPAALIALACYLGCDAYSLARASEDEEQR